MGYSITNKAYRVWNTELRKIEESRDVIFDEDNAEHDTGDTHQWLGVEGEIAPSTQLLPYAPAVSLLAHQPDNMPHQLPVILDTDHSSQPDDDSGSTPTEVDPTLNSEDGDNLGDDSLDLIDDPYALNYAQPDLPQARSPSLSNEPVGDHAIEDNLIVLRGPRTRNLPARLGEWIYPVNRNSYACVACTQSPDEPETYEEAMASPKRELWLAAMQEEYESLVANDIWTLKEIPEQSNLVKCRWIYKLKLAADGSISRYKARLVAKGFTQRKGVDYEETFSLVVKFDSIKTILSIAVAEDLNLTQFDVCTPYLNGLLCELIYMQQSIDFEISHARKKRLVCRLNKAMYGLK